MEITLKDDGKTYTPAASFGDRIIVQYEGIYCMADRINGDEFELSGEPARPGEELDALNALVATIKTTTTVTKID